MSAALKFPEDDEPQDPELPVSQRKHDTQDPFADRAPTSPPTTDHTVPISHPSAGTQLPESQSNSDHQKCSALGSTSTSDQEPDGSQAPHVAGGSISDNSHHDHGTQCAPAVVGSTPPPDQPNVDSQDRHVGRGPILRDGLLAIMADAVDDLERTRIASENRYRQLTRTGEDTDGEERGLGLDESVPEVARVRQVVDGLIALEHQAILTMNRQVRKHPLWKSWGIHQKGVGEKQFARLLATIGDPYWNDLHNRPRTVSELWAYTGNSVVHPAGQPSYDSHGSSAGGVAPKRTKGHKVNWSTNARMRVWLITGSCLKAQGHYADVYYAARDKYADATHSNDCVRCGPAGKPALAGSALSGAHQHARALRAIGKEVLRDVWTASKALHQADA